MIVVSLPPANPHLAAYPVLVTRSEYGVDAPKSVLLNQEPDVSLLATTEVRHRLRELFVLSDNWDGHGSRRPATDAVVRAYWAVMQMFKAASVSGYGWSDPNVSADETGAVVLEWWRNQHKLTIYVGPNEMSYVRVWGGDIDTEMQDGPVDNIDNDFLPLWGWLNS